VFGIQEPGPSGFAFWQRYYDWQGLTETFFSVVGEPVRMEIIGECEPGRLEDDARRKREDPEFPFWREPYFMGRYFKPFRSIDALPGRGVVGMEFTKQ
jgi:hypothetical protein